ncbi:MAG: helix-turn-helix domain-containing protein [Gammaproteobacteria bacterium]|nr:helix-turn-helix domain-containing protein [Gammaproteobacteria bacterium]MCH9744468.1 helix-turn-helix domain-containing protein [Gammaproteobacteria bacterium]
MEIEKTLSTPGDRLRRARVLAGLTTRREFEKKHRISANTLQGWEQGKNPLSEKGARRVVEAFKGEGLICSTDWLLHGRGMPPRPFEMLTAGIKNKADPSCSEFNLREEECIYNETQSFKKQNPNSIVLTIADDAMEPYYHMGDYIGGIQVPIEHLSRYVGQMCILELENNVILPRLLQAGVKEGFYTAACTNPMTKISPLNMYDVRIVCIAPILWHRRKLSSLA